MSSQYVIYTYIKFPGNYMHNISQTFSVSKECVFAYPYLQVPHSEGAVPGAGQGYRISQP